MKSATRLAGYIIALVGVVGVAASTVQTLRNALPFLEPLPDAVLIVVSLLLLVVGVYLILVTTSPKTKGEVEVPILRGKHIVGFRRIKPKK